MKSSGATCPVYGYRYDGLGSAVPFELGALSVQPKGMVLPAPSPRRLPSTCDCSTDAGDASVESPGAT